MHSDVSILLAGDALITRPWSHVCAVAFLRLIDEIRNADVAIANLETVIHEFRGYAQADSGGSYTASAHGSLGLFAGLRCNPKGNQSEAKQNLSGAPPIREKECKGNSADRYCRAKRINKEGEKLSSLTRSKQDGF